MNKGLQDVVTLCIVDSCPGPLRGEEKGAWYLLRGMMEFHGSLIEQTFAFSLDHIRNLNRVVSESW